MNTMKKFECRWNPLAEVLEENINGKWHVVTEIDDKLMEKIYFESAEKFDSKEKYMKNLNEYIKSLTTTPIVEKVIEEKPVPMAFNVKKNPKLSVDNVVEHPDLTLMKQYFQMIQDIGLETFENFHKVKTDNSVYRFFEEVGEGDNSKRVFRHIWLANEIMKEIPNKRTNSGHYIYKNGVYNEGALEQLEQITQRKLEHESKRNRINETIAHIENEVYTPVIEEMNADDDWLNVQNGLLNWKTGELKQHTHERFSTIQFPINYNPDANDSRVLEFIKSIVPGDSVDTLIEMLGYCLVPNVKYQKAFMLHGAGANGKSVLLNLLVKMLGKGNVSSIPLQEIEGYNVAELHNKMANIFADISHNALDNSGTFKALVAGDSMTARKIYGSPFTFTPFAKLIFSCNELPSTKDVSKGYFRRWIIIPFPNNFEKNGDPLLEQKLSTDEALSTLFNLALEGLRRLEQNGKFTDAESITEMNEKYKKDADNVAQFIDELCSFGFGFKSTVQDTYDSYVKYCNSSGLKPLSKIKFNNRVEMNYKDKCSKKKVKVSGKVVWAWECLIVQEVDNFI